MRVLIQAYDYGLVGGIARYLNSFLDNLPADEETRVTVLTSCKEGIEGRHDIDLITLPLNANRWSLVNWSRRCKELVTRLNGENRIDLVNVHIPPLIPGLFMGSAPYVVTAHTTYLGWTKYGRSSSISLDLTLKRKMEKKVLHGAQRVITLTAQGLRELKEIGIPEERISVCPNGVDSRYFSPNGNDGQEKPYDVLFCGRIEPRKGSRSLVKLCRLLVSEKPDIKIVIVGFGEDVDFVQQELAGQIRSANVILTGKVPGDEVKKYYAASKVYASCSYYEGLPGTCLESMSMELPVVVWNMDFYKGLVEHEKSGYLLPMDDFEGMKGKILNLLDSPLSRSRIGKCAREKVVRNYDWADIAKRLLGIMRDACS